MNGHRCDARRGRTLPVHNWMRKHGIDNIRWSIVTREKNVELLKELEFLYIQHYRNAGHDLLNLTEGGDGVLGIRWTDAQKHKMSEQRSGEKNANWGKKFPATGLRNQRLKTGKPGHWAGATRSPEMRAKLSASISGRKFVKKLNPDKVREIRRLFKEDGMMQTKIAERFGVAPQTVCGVLKGDKWSWVK